MKIKIDLEEIWPDVNNQEAIAEIIREEVRIAVKDRVRKALQSSGPFNDGLQEIVKYIVAEVFEVVSK